uniref:C-type lectin domain-containing protein n=1 Tax=Erpetoichthys calabaricus TaxID=27687 RepID=A0A8C4SKQ9_ERPCA
QAMCKILYKNFLNIIAKHCDFFNMSFFFPFLDKYCDEGYTLFEDSCYLFESDFYKSWHEAKQYCISHGGNLASVHNQQTVGFLAGMVWSTSDVWTGLNDLEISNYFTWSSSDIVRFTYWDSGEPNNHNGFNEDCVEMLQQVWVAAMLNYICNTFLCFPKLLFFFIWLL